MTPAAPGAAWDPSVRTLAESMGLDPDLIRWSQGPRVSRALRRCGLVAAAVGTTVHVDEALRATGSLRTRAVIAHELAHVAQQTHGARWLRRDDTASAMEAEAEAVGQLAARGRPLPPRLSDGEPLPAHLQGHDSFEHRLLGDTPTNLLNALVAGQGSTGDRDAGLASACALLDYLGSNPTSVDPARVTALAGFPIRTVTLTGSGLTVTYGELNTMADFLTSPAEIDTLGLDKLLPILQMTRHSGWEKLNALRSSPAPEPTFEAWLASFCPGAVESFFETEQLEALTAGLGPSGRDHYKGVLARNACHFAPSSWWRWQASYNIAVSAAHEAYTSGGNAELVRKAWLAHGYADHFLQDSFAAGHLINKTLVMQWFLDWVAPTSIPIYNWAAFKTMTTANQPGMAGMAQYQPGYTGPAREPQTTEELPTLAQRIANSGVVAAAGLTQEQAYLSYLALLESPVCQIVTNELHDVLNKRSVMASSSTASQFQIWGDDTMLNGGTGAGLASVAAQQSQRSIQEILTRGGTDTTWQQIYAQFPTQVLSNGSYVSLADWHAPGGELWNLCRSSEVFNSTETTAFGAGSYLMPDLGPVSVDEPRSTRIVGGSAPFSNRDCGKKSGVSLSEAGALPIGYKVNINNSTDLSSCIVGNSGARVHGISMTKQSPILYSYVITVDAEGPQGLGSGWLYLYFTDRTGDRYSLGIWRHDRMTHTVAYNSEDPGIVKIEWGDS